MIPTDLKQQFYTLFQQYSDDQLLLERLWSEVEESYTHHSRHYHNLTHIHAMLRDLDPIKHELKDWNSVQFSVFYHDIYYVSKAKDNEEQSAKIARLRLQALGLPSNQLDHIEAQILATKTHQTSTDADTNFLLDADLAILGKPWEHYSAYMQNVRQEYIIYPDSLYLPGRKKVLQHFLDMDFFYKTTYFRSHLEQRAKANLQKELKNG